MSHVQKASCNSTSVLHRMIINALQDAGPLHLNKIVHSDCVTHVWEASTGGWLQKALRPVEGDPPALVPFAPRDGGEAAREALGPEMGEPAEGRAEGHREQEEGDVAGVPQEAWGEGTSEEDKLEAEGVPLVLWVLRQGTLVGCTGQQVAELRLNMRKASKTPGGKKHKGARVRNVAHGFKVVRDRELGAPWDLLEEEWREVLRRALPGVKLGGKGKGGPPDWEIGERGTVARPRLMVATLRDLLQVEQEWKNPMRWGPRSGVEGQG